MNQFTQPPTPRHNFDSGASVQKSPLVFVFAILLSLLHSTAAFAQTETLDFSYAKSGEPFNNPVEFTGSDGLIVTIERDDQGVFITTDPSGSGRVYTYTFNGLYGDDNEFSSDSQTEFLEFRFSQPIKFTKIDAITSQRNRVEMYLEGTLVYETNFLYVNNGSGEFTPETLSAISGTSSFDKVDRIKLIPIEDMTNDIIVDARSYLRLNSIEYETLNESPTITFDAQSTGGAVVGQSITPVYTYSDPEGDAESGTTFQWYLDGVAIDGATESSYTPTIDQLGGQLKVQITPSDGNSFGQQINPVIGGVSCADGYSCETLDVSVCDSDTYQVPNGGPLVTENGSYESTSGTVKTYYNVTFDRAETSSNIYHDAFIAETSSVTYSANTNITGILSFDNTQDFWVELNSLQDDLNNTSRSIFMWIKTGNVSSSEQILFGINPAGNGNTITNLFIDNNGNNLETNDGGNNRNASFDVSGEVWNYVGYTYDVNTNETVIYVNGLAQIAYTNDQSTTATSRYSLGQEFDSRESNHYNGDMAEISVWNEVLSGADVRAAMSAKITSSHPKYANLVGYYSVFGACDDDVAVLKDYSGKGNDGVMMNGFTQDFKNVEAIDGFNSIGWYENISWRKDGVEVATGADFTFNAASGSYELVATRNFVQSTDSWTISAVDNSSTVDGISDETLCTNDAITRSVSANTVNYLDFEKDSSHFADISVITGDLVGTDRSVFMWIYKESAVPSGNSYQLLTIAGDNGIDVHTRFYISAGEKLGIVTGGNDYESGSIPTGEWTHVGYAHDATTEETKMYINGEVIRTITGQDMPVEAGSTASLGMRYDEDGPSRFMDGKMAEITVWDKALTESEVTDLMAAAPAHDAANLVAAYGTLQSIANENLFDLTANGNNGYLSAPEILVTDDEDTIANYDASVHYAYSWSKTGTEFDTDATGNITIDEGTTDYNVTYGLPFFQKSDEFSLSYTNLLPTQPVSQTNGALGSVTFEVSEIAGASYQWYQRGQGINGILSENFPFSDQHANDVLYVNNRLFVATNGGISYTDDQGVNWVTIAPNTNGFSNTPFVFDLCYENGKIFAATGLDVAVSEDNGTSWVSIQTPLDGSTTAINVNGDQIVISSGLSNEAVAISSDGGANWTEIDPAAIGTAQNLNALGIIDNSIFVGSASADGLVTSFDGGANWSILGEADGIKGSVNNLDINGDNIYLATEYGVVISEDKGISWTNVTPSDAANISTRPYFIDIAVQGETIIAIQIGGVFISNDKGLTWVKTTFSQAGLDQGFTVVDYSDDRGTIGFLSNKSQTAAYITNAIPLENNSDNTSTNQIQGATSHQLTINNLTLDKNEAEYFVEVTKASCTQTSDDVTLTVLDVPILTSLDPASGSTDVAIDSKITLTFSRDIYPATNASNMVRLVDENGTEITNITVTRVSPFTNLELTINQDLDYATRYSLLIDEGFVVDLTDGSKAVLAVTDQDAFTFTTACETLVITQPTDQTGYVSGSATFSVPEVSGANYKWYKSTGDLWETTTSGQNGFAGSNTINEISAAGDKIIVGTGGGVSVSTDGGESWSTTYIGENGFANTPTVWSVHADGDNLYAGTTHGVSISNDGGLNWTTITASQNGFATDPNVEAVFAKGNKVYAGLVGVNQALSISSDGGTNWTTISSGENGFATNNSVKAIFADENKVYAGTLGGDLSISTDGGSTWTTTTSGENGFANSTGVYDILAEGDKVYVATFAGLSISSDGGANWSTTTSGQNGFANTNKVYSVHADGDNIYAGTLDGGMSISEDGGATWETITSGQYGFASNKVASLVSIGNQVFAGTDAGLSSLVGNEALETSTDNSADNAISGADTRELTISNLTTAADQTEYIVVVTKGDCEETSNTVTLSIAEVPVLTDVSPAPGATDVAVDTDIVLTFSKIIRAFGGADKKFYLEDEDGVKTSSYTGSKSDQVVTLSLNQPLMPGTKYSILMDEGFVLGTVGSETDISPAVTDNTLYTFTTTCEGLVTTDLTAQTANAGESVTLEIPVVEGATYQWRRLIFGVFQTISNQTDKISGATTNSLTISNLETSDNDYSRYSVTVTTDNCTIKTNEVDITVNAAPAPEITTLSPEDDEIDVIKTIIPSITFDKAIEKGTGNIQIRRSSDDLLLTEYSASSNLIRITDKTATLSLGDAVFDYGTEYYIQIPNGGIVSTDGGTFAGITDKITWSFTIIDAPKLTLESLSPATDATDVALDASFVMTFSEEVQGAIGLEAKLYNATDDSEVIDYSQTANQNLFTFSGNQVTVSFGNYLEASTTYYLQMTNFAVWSKNNSTEFAGISDKTTFRFTTAAASNTTFSHTSFSPSDGATNVETDLLLNPTFNNVSVDNPMRIQFESTISAGTSGVVGIYKVSDDSPVVEYDLATETIGSGQVISGSPSSGFDMQNVTIVEVLEMINPMETNRYGALYISSANVTLENDTEYYVLIDEGAVVNKDDTSLKYEGISDKTTWSFTTEPASQNTFSDVGVYPSNGQSDVPLNVNELDFNGLVSTLPAGVLFGHVFYFDNTVNRTDVGKISLFRASDNSLVYELNTATDPIVGIDGPSSAVEGKANIFYAFGNSFIIMNVDVELEAGTSYYWLIDEGIVEDSETSAVFAGISDPNTWTFTTEQPSKEPLTYISTNPSATRDALVDEVRLIFKFAEAVKAGSGDLTIYNAADNSVFETVNISQLDFGLNDAPRVNPSNSWSFGQSFYVQYPEGFMVSADDSKSLSAVSDATTFTFSVEELADEIFESFYPANGSTNYDVSAGADFEIYFDEDVNEGARTDMGAITVYRASDNSVVKRFELDGENDRDLSYPDGDGVISFEVAAELEPGTEYYVLIDDGFVMSDDNEYYHKGISDPNTWRFTTLAAPGTPSFVSAVPAANATNVMVSSSIKLTYSENIQGNTGNVVLYDGADNLVESFPTNTLSYNGTIVTIDPSADLGYSTTYYVLVDAEAFVSNNGVKTKAITDVNAIRFTTEAKPNTPPTAESVSVTGILEVQKELTGTYTYADADSDTESGSTYQWYVADDAAGANQTAISGATAETFTLTSSESGMYVAFGVKPNDGAEFGEEYLSDYSGPVADAVIPTIVSTVPADGALDIAKDADLSFTFNEAVSKGTGNIILSSQLPGDITTIDVTSAEVTVSGADVTINPTNDLIAGQFYTVRFDASAFVDADGNQSAGLTSVTAWNFTIKAPNPAPIALGVSINKSLVVDGVLDGSYTYFDFNMDAESGTTFKWYRSDDASGTNKAEISGATAADYTVVNADDGKYISFEVTPNDGFQAGTASESALFGPIVINDGLTNIPPAFTSDALTNIKDNETYSYTVTYEDLNSDVPTLTKTTGPDWLSVSGFVLSGDPTSANVGDHSVVLTLDDLNGGTVTQEFTITVEASNTAPSVVGVEISGTTTIDQTLTATYNFIDTENDADNSTFKWYRADDNSGTNKMEISGATNTTYMLTSDDAGKHISFEVTPNDGTIDGNTVESDAVGPVTKKIPSLSLAAITEIYGEADFDLSASTNSTGAVTYSFDNDQTGSSISGSTVTLGNVGTIDVIIDLAEDASYQSRQVTSTITVSRRVIEIAANDASKTYGETDPTLDFTVNKGSIIGSDEVVIITRSTGEDVGTYEIELSDGADAANYAITKTSGTLTINTKAITITADAKTKVYGESDPALTYEITTGTLESGDALSGDLTRVAGNDVNTYAIENTLFNGNYDITFVSADLTITKKALTATADDQIRDEGEENPELTITYDGFVLGDDATVLDTAPSIATTASSASEPGTYDITLSGGSDNNYELTLVNGTLTVNTVNNDPIVANAMADQSYDEGFGTASVSPAGVFTDPDGDNISIAVSSDTESVVTVAINNADGSITITEVGVGTATITVTASDGNGGSVTDEFVVTVSAVNNDPIVANAMADQSYDEGFGTASVSPAGVFTDPDGDNISIAVSSDTESVVTVAINNADGSITITEVGVGTATITVTASDGNGGSVIDEFVVTVNAVNNAPVVANVISDQSENEGFTSNTIDLTNVFTDEDGDVLTFNATSSDESVATVSINGSTLTYTEVANGTTTITVTADDSNGGTETDDFTLTINNVNDAPVLANAISDQSENEGFTSNTVDLTNVFTDEDGDVLTFTATSSDESVATVSINGSTLTYTEVENGTTTITVTADDSNGGTETDDFTLTISNVNDAPVVANAISDQSENEGFASNTIDLTNVFTDEDGDVLTFTATSSDESVATVSINGSTLTYTEVANGTTTITVTADDSNGGTETYDFTLTIIDVNEAPIVLNALADEEQEEGFETLTVDLSDVFEDGDGDVLTYTVSVDDESVVTAFAGSSDLTITEVSPGETTITVTAEDGRGGSVSDAFNITIIKAEVPAEPSIPQGFSPNGDGVNDQWVVPNIENYPNNRVNIFDRGGKLVYSTTGYNNTDNAFEGLANASSAISRSSGLPDGVYYYVIDLGNGETRKGTIIIKQ